jgi:hypothetical protein
LQSISASIEGSLREKTAKRQSAIHDLEIVARKEKRVRTVHINGILCAHFRHQKMVPKLLRFTPPLRLNRPASSTTVPAMKKSIILVATLSVVVMALVSCTSGSDVDPLRVRADTPAPYHEAAPAHSNIGGTGG